MIILSYALSASRISEKFVIVFLPSIALIANIEFIDRAMGKKLKGMLHKLVNYSQKIDYLIEFIFLCQFRILI